MHLHYKIIGLTLIYLLIISRTLKADDDYTNGQNEYGEYEEDDDDPTNTEQEYDLEVETNEKIHKNRVLLATEPSSGETDIPITTAATYTDASSTSKSSHIWSTSPSSLDCPENCFCIKNSHFFLNCSNQGLLHVPKNIPNNVYEIDLSNNNIVQLDLDVFGNLPNLYKINLANNHIEEIEKSAFHGSTGIKILDFSNNSLTQLLTDVFNEAPKLEQLWLSGNPIEMPSIGPFLNQNELKLLDLENCNLTNGDLQTELFTSLTLLKSLNLKNNFLQGNIETHTFEPLKNLQKLKIPELSKQSITDLCTFITSIDLIEVDDKYMVSCFEISAGLTFEESIIETSTVGVVQINSDFDINSNEVVPNEEEGNTQQRDTPIKEENRMEESNVTEIPNKAIATRDNTIQEPHVESDAVPNGNETITSTQSKPFSLSDIPQEIINQILIGLIALVILALIISIIFRRDCCGIKTRLCRTRRPRHTADQISPIPEEVPLNKITTSS